METDANLLLVSRGPVPEHIVKALEERGALVEATTTGELEMTFRVVGPDLVVHFGVAGARETADFLRKDRDERTIRLVLIGSRSELSQLRKLDRRIVLGVLADDMPERIVCERILTLASRKPAPSPIATLPSAQVPSVPPEVQDPHLQRPSPGAVLAFVPSGSSPDGPPPPVSSMPPASEESIRIWLKSTPPPRIAEKEQTDELPQDALPHFEEDLPSALPDLEAESASEWASFDDAMEFPPPLEREEPNREERVVRPPDAQPFSVLTPGELETLSGDGAPGDEDHHDRDTLMMDIDPSSIESEDTIADRETMIELSAEPPAESSLSSVVKDAPVATSPDPKATAQSGEKSRGRLLFVALGLGAVLAASVLYGALSPRVVERSAAVESEVLSGPVPVPPPPSERAEATKPDPVNEPSDPWVRPENASVPACGALLGDKKELRLGDLDQNALLWKRARGKLVIGDREGALTELCRAAYIFPAGLAVEALIEQLLDMDAPRKAEPYMLEAEKARPHRLKTLELKGDLLSRLGDHTGARQTWLAALGLSDPSEKTMRQIGRQIVGQAEAVLLGGQVGLAERLFRRAATLDPQNHAALRALAKIAGERGEPERARAFEALAEKARLGAQ